MKNKILTIVLMCAIVYCTTNNPVNGDDNNTVDPVIITGTEKYKITTYYGDQKLESTQTITGELEKHRAYTIQNFDNIGRKTYSLTCYSDGSSYAEQYIPDNGEVTYKCKIERIE